MSAHVHLIPVGFDFDRLIYPISKGELAADRVILMTHRGEPDDEAISKEAELASTMAHRLVQSFELLDVDVEIEPIDFDALYEYEDLYATAHDYIYAELAAGNHVYVNISSMPRTAAFAFATAADSIITEFQNEYDEIRDRLHTYYVAPDRYLVIRMLEVLENAAETLAPLRDREAPEVNDQYHEIRDLLDRIEESGVTEGAREINGQLYVEFPSSPGSDVDEFEERVLQYLAGRDPIASTSALAEQLAEHLETDYDEAFRSRVQYNVTKLDDKGYVDREQVGNRLVTQLSTMGRMWVKTHDAQ